MEVASICFTIFFSLKYPEFLLSNDIPLVSLLAIFTVTIICQVGKIGKRTAILQMSDMT